MRIIGCLSWYDENPAWLVECVTAASKLCDHLIAVDGPYAAFPGALRKSSSSAEQVDAIVHAAAGVGMGCTIHQPRQPWWDGEVGKRDFMMQLAMAMAEPGEDWLFRVDADEFLNAPVDTRLHLATTEHDVAEVMLWGHDVETGEDGQHPLRCLFRAIPGMKIEGAHFLVTAPSAEGKRFLTGPSAVVAEPLWDVRLEHRTNMRTPARKRLKDQYSPMINTLESVENVSR